MITVFGSINVDQVYQMARLPIPGETLIGRGYLQVPGGKGANQALAAKRSGAKVCLVGCVGNDANADLALQLLSKDNVDLTYLQRSDMPTGCASIWVSGEGENSIVVYAGANASLKADDMPERIIGEGDYVLLQMEVPSEENWKILEIAKNAGAYTVLNLAPAGPIPNDRLGLVDFLIVNEVEAAYLAHSLGVQEINNKELIQYFAQEFGLCCLMTLGAQGAIACNDAGFYAVEAPTVDVVDTTAAGDSFIGGLIAALDRENDMNEAMAYAAKVASLACTKVGAQSSVPYLRESIA